MIPGFFSNMGKKEFNIQGKPRSSSSEAKAENIVPEGISRQRTSGFSFFFLGTGTRKRGETGGRMHRTQVSLLGREGL